jgi:CBS domain-containing protein
MEAWKKFLGSINLESLLEPKFQLISAKTSDSVLDVLKLLREKKITSVPVWDQDAKKWVGMVDMFDIMTVMVFMSDIKGILDAVNHKEVDWYQFVANELKVVTEESIASICDASERNPWCEVSRLKPLNSLMDMFSKNVNIHRVPIVDDGGEVIGLISQSKVINFLYKNVEHFPDSAAVQVKDRFKPGKVVSIGIEKTAIDGYNLMATERVSGLAVVDGEGKLVACLSASDLKGSMDMNLFHDLYLPIGMYLDKGTPEFDRRQSHLPVTCTLSSSIYEVLHKLATNHIHRIFLVDADNRPIGVISLCDIISMMNFDQLVTDAQ